MTKDVILSLIHSPGTSGDDIHTLVDIVFVHGLGGDPYHTWAARESSSFWPQTLLPKDIPGLRNLTFGYQAQATHFTTDIISERAENLLRELVELRGSDRKVSKTPCSLVSIILFARSSNPSVSIRTIVFCVPKIICMSNTLVALASRVFDKLML